MDILIIYGSYSGGTMMAAEYLRDVLKNLGRSAAVRRVEDASADDVAVHDLVVFGSCSWDRKLPDGHRLEGQLQESFFGFFDQLQKVAPTGKVYAVFGLGDSRFFTHYCESVKHLEEMVATVGGSLLVPSLQVDQFFFERQRNESAIKQWAKMIVRQLA